MIKRLYICRSYYHIYNAIKMSNYNTESTVVCISKQFDEENLKSMILRGNNIFSNIKFILMDEFDKKMYKTNEKKYDEIYFFHWNIYKNEERNIYKNYKNSRFYIIEDGVTHYDVFNKDKLTKKIYIKTILNYILTGKKDLVLKNNVKNIYVSKPENYPKYMEHKLKKLNEFYNEEKEINYKITELFDINTNFNDESKKCIVFTQPLSEDGYMLEEYKINLYKDIIEYIKKEKYQVILKKHPRDNSIYNLDTDVINLSKDFPAEVLNYMHINFELSISICSGIIYNFNSKNKIQIEPNFFNIKDQSEIDYISKLKQEYNQIYI